MQTISRSSIYLNASKALINVLLPPELLGEIFKQCMLMCTEYFAFETYIISPRESPYRWFRVAFVCRYWRAIALSMGELFTRLDITHPLNGLTRPCLAQSKQCPVQIIGRINETNRRWKVALPYMDRALILRIYTTQDTCLPATWPPTLPNLKSLSCTYTKFYSREASLPHEVINGLLVRSPNLESLAVHLKVGGTAAWMWHVSHPFLTRLRIHGWQGQRQPSSQYPDGLDPFLALICRLPKLEFLEIDSLNLPWDLPLEQVCHTRESSAIHPLTCFKASGSLTSIMTILTSGAIAPQNLDITFFHSQTLCSDDIQLMVDALVATHNTPWKAVISAGIWVGSGSVPENHIHVVTLKGWTHCIPSAMHDTADILPNLNLTVNMCASPNPYLKSEVWNMGSDFTFGFTKALPAVESASVHNSAISYPSSSDIDSIIDHFCNNNLKRLRNLQIPAYSKPYQIFLSNPRHHLIRSHLSVLHIVFGSFPFARNFSIFDYVQGLRVYLSSPLCRRFPRLEALVLELTSQETWKDFNISTDLEKLRGLVGELRLQERGT